MKIFPQLFPASAFLALCAATFCFAGCGAVIGLPIAVSQNTFIAMRGTIVDDSGTPVDGVTIQAQRRHILWDPAHGGTADTPDTTTLVTDHKLDIWPRRAFQITFIFSKPGYGEARIEAYRSGYQMEMDRRIIGSTWPLDSAVSVLLVKNPTHPSPLSTSDRSISIHSENASSLQLTPDVELHAKLSGAERVTLWFEDPNAGFLVTTPDASFNPLSQMTQAPASPYEKQLVIAGAKFEKFSDSGNVMVLDRNVFFYFRCGGKYGKAVVSMQHWNNLEDAQLRLDYLIQPNGTRDVSSW